jgi:hypothetical protein
LPKKLNLQQPTTISEKMNAMLELSGHSMILKQEIDSKYEDIISEEYKKRVFLCANCSRKKSTTQELEKL